MNLLLQVIGDIIKERFEIGDARRVIVDPVCRRKKPRCRRRKDRDLRDHLRKLTLPAEHLEHHVEDKGCDADGLDQEPGRRIIQIVFLNRPDIALAALCVLIDEVALLVRDLDLLDSGHRLIDPLIESAVIVLIVLSRLQHDRLNDIADDDEHKNQDRRDGHRHLRIRDKQDRDESDEDNDFREKLQKYEDQCIHVVDVRRDIPLDDRRVRTEIILVRPHHEIDHHAVARVKLIRIDEFELGLVGEEKNNVLHNEDENKPDHHEDGKIRRR